MSRRAAVVVLDACGVGELPDAADYGDAGANTLAHVAEAVGGLDVPMLERLGLGSILPIAGVAPARRPGRARPPRARWARARTRRPATGSSWAWSPPAPLPTYPDGFPAEVVDAVAARDRPALLLQPPGQRRGQVIDDLGEHHLRTGEVILYTSADSVLQLAAHERRADARTSCGAACAAAREVMIGEHAVGRVIARPFGGDARRASSAPRGARTSRSCRPPAPTCRSCRTAGVPVHAVGKVRDLFAGVGIDEAHPGATNERALAETTAPAARASTRASCSPTSSRPTSSTATARTSRASTPRCGASTPRSPPGSSCCAPDDLLVLTADHGVDPPSPHSDHTREHAPLLAVFDGHDGRRHDGPLADVGRVASCAG